MARGGGKRRTYVRDANGRFASTPGGGLGAARKAARPRTGRTSTLGARTSLKKSRAKLASKDPADQRLSTALSTRAQKGAVTRGNKKLKAAKVASQAKISGGKKGVIGKLKGLKPGALAERATGKPVNTLKRTGKTIKIAAKILPVKRSALDKNFERIIALKSAEPVGGRSRSVFLTYKQMTRSRSKALGLDKNSIYAQSPLYRASESTHPITLQGGYFVGPRSGVKDRYRAARLAGTLLRRQSSRQKLNTANSPLLNRKNRKPKP